MNRASPAANIAWPPAPVPRRVDCPLPAALHAFGRSVRALSLGDPQAPPLLLLGGISADAEAAVRPDGSPGWWHGLAGPGRALDPARHHLIGVDFAADATGRLAPSTQDQAAVMRAALDHLRITRPVQIVGASYGGMVALALAAQAPQRVAQLTILSAPAVPHPAASAARELQRRVVALGLAHGAADEALAIARGMAMMSYRTAEEFAARFDGGIDAPATDSIAAPGAYLRARGAAFVERMSPQRFISLSASIDRHRVDPATIRCPALVIGASNDQLVRREELTALASGLAGPSSLHLFDSLYGHDFFLKECDRYAALVAKFVEAGQ